MQLYLVKDMLYKSFFFICAFILICSPLPGQASKHRYDEGSRLSGFALENQLWGLIKNNDEDKLSDLISPMFLGRSSLGLFNHDKMVTHLMNLDIQDFQIIEVQESQAEDVRIISYHFIANGESPVNDYRVSVWKRVKYKHHLYYWRLINHSYF